MVLETRMLLWLPVTSVELSTCTFDKVHEGAGHSHSEGFFRGTPSPTRIRPIPGQGRLMGCSVSSTLCMDWDRAAWLIPSRQGLGRARRG